MNTLKNKRHRLHDRRGTILGGVLVLLVILSLVGFAMIKISEGALVQTTLYQNESIAMSTAEAAYEQAIYWMGQNPELLMQMEMDGTVGTVAFENSHADYRVKFHGFVGYRPIFEVTANGYCGTFHRSIRVHVVQAISGWEMGQCRIPISTASTREVYFADGEVLDMPIHINSYKVPDDPQRDIHISGRPSFLQEVSMGESRHSVGGHDKYASVIHLFDAGISFDQPKSLISDEDAVQSKIEWYKDTIRDQRSDLVLTPQKDTRVPEGQAAVQLEFYVGTDGKGYVRMTNDCTVRGKSITSGTSDTWDYKAKPGSDGTRFEKYSIYGFHYIPENAEDNGLRTTHSMASTQMTVEYAGYEAPPCGMIYVDGNVIIGSANENTSSPGIAELNKVQGVMSVVATGNIWLANSVTVSDKDDDGSIYLRQDNGMPSEENPNGLGLFAGGVVKVLDPGMVENYASDGHWEWVRQGRRRRRVWVEGNGVPEISGLSYEPIGIKDSGQADGTYHRHLPDPMVIEAAITVGGGGWGAENVRRSSGGGRKEASGSQDELLVRGTITEVIRGVVGLIGSDGYLKHYYFDQRMLSGLIPGNVRLKGKFTTAPGGWSDFRIDPRQQEE